MSVKKMHADELDIDESLVRRLLAAQVPQWAHLPIAPVPSAGTDHAIYRLGEEMAVRLPRIHWATDQAEKEHRWLPVLAPHLPLAVPVPLAIGAPGEGYPWQWSIAPWLKGENAAVDRIGDLREAAADLAGFVAALQRIDPAGGPRAGPENGYRGSPLADRDRSVRRAIAAVERRPDIDLDTDAVTAAWDAALRAPAWPGPPVWVHGDLLPGNLLVERGRLSAVIDFGCLGAGDPAADLSIAWTLFSGESRDVYRAALAVDDATWARGRGWALTTVIALPYYWDTNPVIIAYARRAIAEVLADHESGASRGPL